MPSALSPVLEKQRRGWKRTYLISCLLIAAFIPLGLLLHWPGHFYWWLLAWCGSMLVGATSVQVLPRRFSQMFAYGIAGFSGICAAVLTSVYGPYGGSFGLLLALPLGVMAMSPSTPVSALLVGLGTLAGGLYSIWHFELGAEFAVVWVSLWFGLTAVALVGARNFRKVWMAELDAQHGKMDALQRLAKSERRLAQVERLAVTGRLTAAVGHEINNPLAVVKSNLDVLRDVRRTGKPLADENEVLEEMATAVDRIARTVLAMRRLAQSETATLEPVAVSPLVDLAWSKAVAALSVVRATRPEPAALQASPAVLGVLSLLSQALTDLLVNAGEAALTAPNESDRWVRLELVTGERDALSLVVVNGGPPVAPEVQRRLFEPFFTTKGPRRTGLGLALAREQAMRCGGTLEGTSLPQGGARFVLRLQLAEVVD